MPKLNWLKDRIDQPIPQNPVSLTTPAGVPGAGLILMSLVLSAIGVPLETIAFVAGINHLLDTMRTMTNVTGDAVVAMSVGRMAGEIDVEEHVSDDDV